jgi:hypothetical protein
MAERVKKTKVLKSMFISVARRGLGIVARWCGADRWMERNPTFVHDRRSRR